MSPSRVRRSMQKLVLALMAGILVFPAAVAADDNVQLAYKFEAGFSQQSKCEFNQSQDFYGMNYVILVEMELTENCIEALGDTVYVMELIFDEISSSMTMNDNIMPNNFEQAFKGQTVSYRIDKSGEVTDVKAKSYIEGWRQFGETVKMIIGGFYPHLPEKTVTAGENWTEELKENPDDNPGLEVVTEMSYEFKEMKKEKGHECAKISAKSNSTFSGVITTPQGELDTDGTSKSESEFFFMANGSGIVKFKVKTETDAKMVKAAGVGSGEEEMEMHRSYEIKKELK